MSGGMPEWLEWQAELDFCRWQLAEMLRAVHADRDRTPMERLIDKATGYESAYESVQEEKWGAVLEDAKALIARAQELEVLLGLSDA